MISKLNILNFKTHRDTRLDIGGLTVLTGVNSSGKSTVLQSLLLLRQSYLKSRLESGLELNDSLCRLGIGQDVLYHFADSNKMVFEFEDGGLHRFAFNVESCLDKSFLPLVQVSNSDRMAALGEMSLFGKNFQYVSSLRGGGSSHYDRYDYEVDSLHQISKEFGQGEAVAHYLYQFGGELSSSYLDESIGRSVEIAEQVEGWERRLSSGLTIDVQKGASGGFDIFYGYAREGVKPITGLRAENIGYGISHALPIVVALVSAKPGALVVLENPEAQLHPRGQSEIASLICRAVQNGVQVILETHSDHILSGVQLAALRHEKGIPGGVDRNNIRIYYFEKENATQAFVNPIRVGIAEDGRLDHQPEGFFDQEEQVFFETNRILSNGN